ncbi:hypothetical protein LZ32DRAFT_602144 [Colletotrichum eremochloae]|nr:hypothetical protein LZ32DRAFT_602144 [Colletotrichum eremochloae]
MYDMQAYYIAGQTEKSGKALCGLESVTMASRRPANPRSGGIPGQPDGADDASMKLIDNI